MIPSPFPAPPSPVAQWGGADWRLAIHLGTGALLRIAHVSEPERINWLREAGCWDGRAWVRDDSANSLAGAGPWGLVEWNRAGLLHSGAVRRLGDLSWEIDYVSPLLTVTVRRELADDGLRERYLVRNTGPLPLDFPVGSLGVTAPLFDQYPDAARSLAERCHVHLWMGGRSSWINALRMNARAPHLGLVLTEGSLAAYGQRGGTISDRGHFILHPDTFRLEPGQGRTFAWRFFWHTGWEDFFALLDREPGFVRLAAPRLVARTGETLTFHAGGAGLPADARLFANSQPLPSTDAADGLAAQLTGETPGELHIELVAGGHRSRLAALVVPPVEELIAARVRRIVSHHQRHAPGDPLNGAYLIHDRETNGQVYEAQPWDHNAGRERLAMGVLGALYLPACDDPAFREKLRASLISHGAFVARELEDEHGFVFNNLGRDNPERLYNSPWAVHLHLALHRALGDTAELDRAMRVLRRYYAEGGAGFYAIGLPVRETLRTLETAGRRTERDEALALFRGHADRLLAIGCDYPASEVNYEQSIVAPAVQLLLEVYLATRHRPYLDGALLQLPLLEAFEGRQPDHRLHGVSIRHWDSFWFGKHRHYGDTFPHYWSTLNGVVHALLGAATGDRARFDRADRSLLANLSLFDRDGRASCVHVYPLSCDGRPAACDDPWANDQDWALVNWLSVRELESVYFPDSIHVSS